MLLCLCLTKITTVSLLLQQQDKFDHAYLCTCEHLLVWQRRQRRHMIQACLIDCLQHSMLCQLSPQTVLHILRVQHICLCLFLLGAPAQWHNVAQHSMARHSFVQKQQNLGTVQASVSALANPKTTIFMQKTSFYSANPNPETSGDSTHVFLHWGHVFSN